MTAEELWDQNYKEDKNLSEFKRTYRTVNDEGKRFLFASAMTAKSMYQVVDRGGAKIIPFKTLLRRKSWD